MRIELENVPGLSTVYPPLLLRGRRRQLSDGQTLPPVEVAVGRMPLDAARVREYRIVCGFGPGDSIPVTYPLVAAFPLQLALLGQREWPLHAAGLVHVGVEITQHAALSTGIDYAAACRLDAQERTQRGLEFELVVELTGPGGVIAWSGRSRVLARGAGRTRRRSDRGTTESPPMLEVGRFEARADTGRRYARVSGDWNPIHLAWLGARAFGFPRAIAHGMWTLARTLAELREGEGRPGRTVRAEFRAPLWLPGAAGVHAEPPGDRRRFVVREYGVGRTLLTGVNEVVDAVPRTPGIS